MKSARDFFEGRKRIIALRLSDRAETEALERVNTEAREAGVRDEYMELIRADFMAALDRDRAECHRVMRENGWEVAR